MAMTNAERQKAYRERRKAGSVDTDVRIAAPQVNASTAVSMFELARDAWIDESIRQAETTGADLDILAALRNEPASEIEDVAHYAIAEHLERRLRELARVKAKASRPKRKKREREDWWPPFGTPVGRRKQSDLPPY